MDTLSLEKIENMYDGVQAEVQTSFQVRQLSSEAL